MCYSGEVAKTAGEGGFVYSCGKGGKGSRKAIAEIVFAGEGKLRKGYFEETGLVYFECCIGGKTIGVVAALALSIGYDAFALVVGKRQHLLSVVVTGKFAGNVFIVSPVDEAVVGRLVLGDAHFGTNIAHHFKVVAIEVVGGDVEQHGNVGSEVVHIVELERGDFQHIPIAVAFFFDFCYLKCERTTDVSS